DLRKLPVEVNLQFTRRDFGHTGREGGELVLEPGRGHAVRLLGSNTVLAHRHRDGAVFRLEQVVGMESTDWTEEGLDVVLLLDQLIDQTGRGVVLADACEHGGGHWK